MGEAQGAGVQEEAAESWLLTALVQRVPHDGRAHGRQVQNSLFHAIKFLKLMAFCHSISAKYRAFIAILGFRYIGFDRYGNLIPFEFRTQ
jgi:hypothetical protein